MDYSSEFLNEPSGEDMGRFFTLERELDCLTLNAEQRERKEKILRDITQFIGSRERFMQFLSSLEVLREEARSNPESGTGEGQHIHRPDRDERFEAYWSQFNQVEEERLRTMITGEVKTLSREALVFLYTVIMGFQKNSGERDGGRGSRTRGE